MACPLGVYQETAFVELGDVNDALQSAIVEMFFSIRHYYLRDKKFDTFQADMQQINIIKPGASIASSGFKRRNARDGPLDVVAMGGVSKGEDKECEKAAKKVRSGREK
jgi:hypothetical protein